MSRLPRVSSREVLVALRRAGFVEVRSEGSHRHLTTPGSPAIVTVAVHAGETIAPKTLRSILRQAGLTEADFRRLL